jgi:hypothetical protein
MARFHFINLRSTPVRGGVQAQVSQRTLKALHLADEGDADESLGPGWFGSSWDLVSGLEVREGLLSSDAALNDWLASCLRAAPADSSTLAAEGHEQPGACLVPAAPHGAFGDAVQLGDLGLAVAAEVTHLDEFGEFGIDGLELV